jgi:small neutral amino acid transporter SnatA (MarC family)
MSYDLNKWVENERATVTRKRYLPYVLTLMIALIVGLALLEVFDGASDEWQVASHFGPTLLLLTFALVSSPFGRDGFAGFRNGSYDEFEKLVLLRATFRAFTIMLVLILSFFLWLWLASSFGWPMPRTPLDWSAFGFAFLAVGAVLPVLMAEIMVPMPPRGEQDEDGA